MCSTEPNAIGSAGSVASQNCHGGRRQAQCHKLSPSHGWIRSQVIWDLVKTIFDQENLTDGLTHEMIWMEVD